MKSAIALVFCAATAHAQISATLHHLPGRSSEVEIRNNSTVSLNAFALAMAPVAEGRAPLIVFVDTVMDNGAAPLLPGEAYPVPVTSGTSPGHSPQDLFGPPVVTAGIRADGTTTGDPALVRRLILRRCNMAQAVELAMDLLSDAGKHNLPRYQLIGQFRKLADSLDHWYLPPEQQVGRMVYDRVISRLLSLPDGSPGAPFPPAEFVEQETARLNRQRITLLESQPNLADAASIQR